MSHWGLIPPQNVGSQSGPYLPGETEGQVKSQGGGEGSVSTFLEGLGEHLGSTMHFNTRTPSAPFLKVLRCFPTACLSVKGRLPSSGPKHYRPPALRPSLK